MKRPRITDIRATTVTVPLEAPLRHSNGAHWGRFVRTIVEVETDVGIVGLGEMGGGGESAEAAFRALKPYLLGHDTFELENLRFMICNPTASLYNNRTQMHAAIEFACLDIMGKFLGVPVCDLLGGKMRDAVPFASYMFFRLPNKDTGEGETRTADQLIEQTLALKKKCGFTSHKLKSGVFPPDYELEVFRAWAKALGPDSVRYDPNAAFSVEEAIRFAKGIEDLNNDYYEDPTWGLNGMRRVRENTTMPLATNTVVVNFEQLATNILNPAVDVILLDTTFWGGSALREGGGRLRDLPTRHCGTFVGRTRHPARHHASPRRGSPEPRLPRGCALSPTHGRYHRRRPDALRERHYQGADGAGSRGGARSRQARAVRRPP
ncbi:dehydratase/enolase (plasmid) [Sinorhizobium meliloti 1021]|uniref:glucarate dehydratase n=1 Tax=Rhizobium meliloti (strain 1021) TaxID=266834 RepID=Q931B9_RHIME|nr:dehydratase/enolase [Sinorhizobium meliloti 1021]